MKIKVANEEYLKKAKDLPKVEVEKLQCRMGNKLFRRAEDKKLSLEEALAIQLEIEDQELMEWRKKRKEVLDKNKKDN
jgi:hypothetical protein